MWIRYVAPLPRREHSIDLKPDWSSLYAYGCRAYPLDRDREAGRRKRDFKTNPRGHIGYLVGYVASNIYRIWIPRLGKVITTRNVLFNENIYFDPRTESSTEQPVITLNDWVLQQDVDNEVDYIAEEDGLIPTTSRLNSGVETSESSELQCSQSIHQEISQQDKEPQHAPD